MKADLLRPGPRPPTGCTETVRELLPVAEELFQFGRQFIGTRKLAKIDRTMTTGSHVDFGVDLFLQLTYHFDVLGIVRNERIDLRDGLATGASEILRVDHESG